ncbi:MAG: hypothetical protein HC821_02415 [Lewinella sp.]|nr:hypothetical protein [Lewinella sp.]
MPQPFTRGLRLAALLVFMLVPLVNYLAVANGSSQFDDDVPTRVDAADYAFSIWGLIFGGMLLFSWALWRQKDGPASTPQSRGLAWLIVAGLASMVFVPLSFLGNQFLVWLDLLAHLLPLILANQALRQHATALPSATAWRWAYAFPSVYLGWISAATVISTALMLVEQGLRLSLQVETTIALVLVGVLF